LALLALASRATAQTALLNVSYDPTREFYQDFNVAFAKYWKGKTGQDVAIRQSHGDEGRPLVFVRDLFRFVEH
jgi:sulfate transport system substrate-binding protein